MYDLQDQLEKALQKNDFDTIDRIVKKECRQKDGTYFSGFISVFAEALTLLGDRGRLQITNDNGGRVVEAVDLRE